MFRNIVSRNLFLASGALLFALTLSACGGGDPAGAAPLPTLAPTYTPVSAASAAPAAEEPTATVAPTAEPTATDAPTATAEPTATEEPTATVAPTATAAPTATEEPTATPGATTPAEPTATKELTATVAPAAPAEPAAAAEPTATVAPTAAAQLLPEAMVAALTAADPVRGQELSVSTGCIACHALGEGQQLVGPSWYGIGARAGASVPGQPAEEYLYRSIVAPNEHLVEGFAPNLMPAIYGDIIPTQDLADIISYLLSLE